MKKFTAIFFLILLTPLLLSGFYFKNNQKYINTVEKRQISSFPKVISDHKINNNFSVEFEKWLQDHIAFRPEVIKLYNKLFKKNSTKVLYGENGYLFYKQGNSVNLFKRNIQLSDKQIHKKINDLITIATELKENNIKFYWLIPPNKHTIYPEYFPKNISRLDQASVLDQIIRYVDKNNLSRLISIIDLRKDLQQNKSNFKELYYKTDTHWNQLGAFVGHTALINNLQNDFNDIPKKLTLDDFYIKKSKINGDLAMMLSTTMKSNEFILEPKFKNQIVTKHLNKKKFITNNSNPISNKTAIIYRDSFFDNMHDLTSHYFTKTTYISDKIRVDQLDEIKQQKPDIVIYELIERHI